MTSEVMVVMALCPHNGIMKKLLPFLVLMPFSIFTTELIVRDGYFGFYLLAWREPWAMQMLIDLSISLVFAAWWIRRDAKERGLPWIPYLVLLPILGSPAALAYLCHRVLCERRSSSVSMSTSPAGH